MNSTVTHSGRAYERIARAIRYLDTHRREQPGLAELGAQVGLSESHLQREFSAWAGVSPKQFLQYLSDLEKEVPTEQRELSEELYGALPTEVPTLFPDDAEESDGD